MNMSVPAIFHMIFQSIYIGGFPLPCYDVCFHSKCRFPRSSRHLGSWRLNSLTCHGGVGTPETRAPWRCCWIFSWTMMQMLMLMMIIIITMTINYQYVSIFSTIIYIYIDMMMMMMMMRRRRRRTMTMTMAMTMTVCFKSNGFKRGSNRTFWQVNDAGFFPRDTGLISPCSASPLSYFVWYLEAPIYRMFLLSLTMFTMFILCLTLFCNVLARFCPWSPCFTMLLARSLPWCFTFFLTLF